MLALKDVPNSAAVRNHISAEAPFAAQNQVEQLVADAVGFSIQSRIGAHHGESLTFAQAGFESGQISFTQIALIHLGVEAVPLRLGPAVGGEMLGRRDDL